MANEFTSQNDPGVFPSESVLDILKLIFAAAPLPRSFFDGYAFIGDGCR
jgi:hypothetical protein